MAGLASIIQAPPDGSTFSPSHGYRSKAD